MPCLPVRHDYEQPTKIKWQCHQGPQRMFEIRPLEDKNWCIVDPNDQPVFSGTYEQCEDWLDLQEAISREAAKRPGLIPRLLSSARALFSPRTTAAADSNSVSKSESSEVSVKPSP